MEVINCLNCPSLKQPQIDLLRTKNIETLVDFIAAPRDDVCSLLEIVDDEYNILRQKILLHLRPCPISLRQQVVSESDVPPQATGISSLDLILRGGLYPGNIIELYGKTGTCKTQLCLHLAAQICHFHEDPSGVLYFDLKNDFSPKRLLELCENSLESLENVKVFKPVNFETLLLRLDNIRTKFTEGINGFYCNSKLLIIDSVPMVIYPVVQKENYSWRFHLEKLMEKLKWIAHHLRLSVILVNHAVTTRSTNAGPSYKSTPDIKAAMGKYWQTIVPTRFLLVKNKSANTRVQGILDKCNSTYVGQKFEFNILDGKLVNVDTNIVMGSK